MLTKNFDKDPQADLDYSINWADWLAGDTLVTSAWATADSTIALGTDTNDDTVTVIWLSGGTLGKSYKVVNTVTTAFGRTEQRTLTIKMVNK